MVPKYMTMTASMVFLFFLSLAIFGCVGILEKNLAVDDGSIEGTGDDPITLCISICEQYKANGTDLSSGPCLSNDYYADYVCDVAHSPREPVDNNPLNQCESFRNGSKHHFVEVDLECNMIRVV